MVMQKNILEYKKYFFIFAHPDDEVYSCALMNKLSKQGKKVHAIYATSGDAGGKGDTRMRELKSSLKLIGVSLHLHLLNIPERKVLDNFERIILKINSLIKKYNPDCVVSHDYEGGHEVHDSISYCASEIINKHKKLNFFIFPVYHGKPQERKGARFKSTRKNIIELFLNGNERKLKTSVLKCHKSQADLKKSAKIIISCF
jgi:LmbE family N-acetylglucosaminyl deacetylase